MPNDPDTSPDRAAPEVDIEKIMDNVRARADELERSESDAPLEGRFDIGVEDPRMADQLRSAIQQRAGKRPPLPATSARGFIAEPPSPSAGPGPPPGGPFRKILRRLRERFYRVTRIQFHLDALHQRITESERQREQLVTRVDEAKRLIGDLEARVDRALSENSSEAQRMEFHAHSAGQEKMAVALQEEYRGSSDSIGQLMQRRLPLIIEAVRRASGGASLDLLDVGCGRGELLNAATASGLRAQGLDSNRLMVERCVNAGLDALCTDVRHHLSSLERDSAKAITFLHGVEHVPASELQWLLENFLRILAPGGGLILEFPNIFNLLTASNYFYIDDTHDRPVHPYTVEFLLKHTGFEKIEMIPDNPAEERLMLPKISPNVEGADQINQVIDRLNQLLYGPQDMIVKAFKPFHGA